jgi:hypothetical protein
MWKKGVRTIAKEIQKPPYEESAVAPKVFPTAISLEFVSWIEEQKAGIWRHC